MRGKKLWVAHGGDKTIRRRARDVPQEHAQIILDPGDEGHVFTQHGGGLQSLAVLGPAHDGMQRILLPAHEGRIGVVPVIRFRVIDEGNLGTVAQDEAIRLGRGRGGNVLEEVRELILHVGDKVHVGARGPGGRFFHGG